jgi:hypothetical protein
VAKPKVWEPIDGGNRFKCVACDYSHEDPGAVRLHHARRHAAGKEEAPAKTKTKTKKAPAAKGCAHTWALLNPRVEAHRPAIAEGYTEYCTRCDDLKEG